jgi:hypothetical protein
MGLVLHEDGFVCCCLWRRLHWICGLEAEEPAFEILNGSKRLEEAG